MSFRMPHCAVRPDAARNVPVTWHTSMLENPAHIPESASKNADCCHGMPIAFSLDRASPGYVGLHPAAMHQSPRVLRRRTRLVRRKPHVLVFALQRVPGTRPVHLERVTPRGLLQVGLAIGYSSCDASRPAESYLN